MAEAETNPVLQVLNLNEILEENKKYPTELLHFNQTGWRAYYHCHPASRSGNHRFQGEHGHFHIFVRTHKNPEEWSHLVALAMDSMGQPLGWFTVNHWVTAETWKSVSVLAKHLNSIAFSEQKTLVERWLLSLLALSCEQVKSILDERDRVLKQYELKSNNNIKQDKNIYILSAIPIVLTESLNRGCSDYIKKQQKTLKRGVP